MEGLSCDRGAARSRLLRRLSELASNTHPLFPSEEGIAAGERGAVGTAHGAPWLHEANPKTMCQAEGDFCETKPFFVLGENGANGLCHKQ